MKKSLLALAVLGAFAGTAAAQSSVTIYGVLDLAITKGNGGDAANPGANGTSEAWTMKQSTTSRLGFRGNEDLGGGLSAQFQIEHRFNPDDGSAQNPFWTGRSYVQLTSASAGAVYLGREYSPAFWVALKSDPFGFDGVGQMGAASWAGYLNSEGGVRTSNTVGYKTPNMGGLTANVAVGLSEGPAAGRNTGFNVEYAAGPIYAGLAYEKVSDGTVKPGNGLVNFAVHYDFGFVKPRFYYAKSKIGPNGDVSGKFLELSATAPLGNGLVKAAYYSFDPNDSVDNDKRTKIGLGYNYNLSKRTNLYFDLGLGREDNKSNNTAYAVGVRHTF